MQRTAAGATQARRAGLAPEGTHTVHTLVNTHTYILIPVHVSVHCFLSCPVWVFLEPRREKTRSRECTGKRRFYMMLEEELEKPL